MFTPVHHPLLNRSGSITAGGTAQNVYAPADAPKYHLHFRNISDTDMWIDFDRDAAADAGIQVKAGEAYEPPAGIMFKGRMSVLCATTGKKFVCKTA